MGEDGLEEALRPTPSSQGQRSTLVPCFCPLQAHDRKQEEKIDNLYFKNSIKLRLVHVLLSLNVSSTVSLLETHFSHAARSPSKGRRHRKAVFGLNTHYAIIIPTD